MGGEKHGSKTGGGYVGGFLQLFDWNGKSRKKLFSGKSDLPEQSRQRKRSDGNFPITRFNLMDEDEFVAASSIKGSSDYSCASSVTDEDGYGTRAPSVVARLMGLDSLPTSNLQEPFSTPFLDSQSLRGAHYHQRNLESYQKAMEPKSQKVISRPIEKFQSEILPPKSAKSIPVTHHKLLSPIKSPGFVPSKNAAHIMEAAAKIIEPGPQVPKKTKMSLIGNSSVPFKVRDMKEKVDASRRPVEATAAKFLMGESVNKSLNGSVDVTLFRVSPDSEDCSSKDKGKSVSLALQAKVNVQRREGLSPSGSRSKISRKEQSEFIPSQAFTFQQNSQRNMVKKPPSNNASSVLRQNHQKQNCVIDKERLPSKPMLSNSQGRKVLSRDSSARRHKNPSNHGGHSIVGKREVSNSGMKNVPRKKRSIDGNFQQDKNQALDSLLNNNAGKQIQSDSFGDRDVTWVDDRKRKGLDVVSFTFTAPMKNNGFSADYGGKKLSSKRCNVTEADDLSILLEHKLRELTRGVESSCYGAGMASNSVSIFQDLLPTPKAVPKKPISRDRKNQDGMHIEKLVGQYGSSFSGTDLLGLKTKHKLQGMVEMDESSSNDTETRKLLHGRYPSPISVLEPSCLTESCDSLDSADSNSIEGNKHCSSIQAQGVLAMSYSKKSHLLEADAEVSDSASSTYTRTVAKRKQTNLSMSHFVGSTMWEAEYVKKILFNVELMFKDFALGRSREIINPHLFDLLENQKEVLGSQGNEPKLRRKVLFDCVGECMNLRCKTWSKGISTLRKKERLAEEVYKEISSWRGRGDSMVDDLVDKDMSTHYGKWLDFEVEEFELGVEIEGRILNSLVNEVVADILVL